MATSYQGTNAKALRELIETGGIPFRETSVSYIFDCPRCGKPDKLYMYKETGRFCCWICKETEGFQGRPEYALADLLSQPLATLRKKLYGIEAPQGVMYLDISLRDWFGDGDEVDEDASELAEQAIPLDFYPIDHKFGRRGLEYLRSRGVDLETAKRYELRYCPPQQRLIFPIGSRGRVYGWQARKVTATEIVDEETGEVFKTPKITTTKGLHKEQTLMFQDRMLGQEHVVFCEGPMDAIKADLCGGNVATMGKAVSGAQIQLLRNSGVRKVYLALDPDAGQEIYRLSRELNGDLELYDMRAPEPFKDLGEMSASEVLSLFKSAEPIQAGRLFTSFNFDRERIARLEARNVSNKMNRTAFLRGKTRRTGFSVKS